MLNTVKDRGRIEATAAPRYGRLPSALKESAPLRSPAPRLRLAVAGMGGYAKLVTDHLLNDSANPDGLTELVAVCDPQPLVHGDRAEKLRSCGVEVGTVLESLLQRSDVDAVWLPLPIELHREATETALRHGKHVVCEKPAAATVSDIDAMIRARDAAAGPICAIGFQDLYRPAVRRLKNRLLSGELGRPVRASVVGSWPRNATYFSRNTWAGKLRKGDAWVLDSVASNAMAHFVNLALFLLGSAEDASTSIAKVEAELYRGNVIENFDTCTLRIRTTDGIECLVALTHASEETIEPSVTIVTDRTRICLQHPDHVVYGTNGSAVLEPPEPPAGPHTVANAVARRLRGDDAPIATLESARVHTQLINAISEASPIISVPDEAVHVDGPIRGIVGIEDALRRCASEGCLLHELGQFDWTRPAGAMSVGDAYQFQGRIA